MMIRTRFAPTREGRGGYALMAVLGVLVLLVVYLVTVQGVVMMTTQVGKVQADRQSVAEAVPSLILMSKGVGEAGAELEAPAGQNRSVPYMVKAHVNRHALPAGDALWVEAPGLEPMGGDELVAIRWLDKEGHAPHRYIVNPRRAGMVRLAPPKQASAPETQSADSTTDPEPNANTP